jgi:hypothetical protein
MIPIPNKYHLESCFLELDEDIYFHIVCDNDHVEDYYLLRIANVGLDLVGNIRGNLYPSLDTDCTNESTLFIDGVDDV